MQAVSCQVVCSTGSREKERLYYADVYSYGRYSQSIEHRLLPHAPANALRSCALLARAGCRVSSESCELWQHCAPALLLCSVYVSVVGAGLPSPQGGARGSLSRCTPTSSLHIHNRRSTGGGGCALHASWGMLGAGRVPTLASAVIFKRHFTDKERHTRPTTRRAPPPEACSHSACLARHSVVTTTL